ncbi:MAG: cysteine synthase family protein [Chloroflexi bacterium]|nr:cysteine synthase family protein [Chloroflexota bacterium]
MVSVIEKKRTGILNLIGGTPLDELANHNGAIGVKICGKLEGNNPGGSVKDRAAYYMIARAEASGALTPARLIVEPTSGNTGISLAMIGAAKGYRIKLFMPECVSVERQLILQAFGAEIVLTPAREGVDGAIRRAHQLADAEPATTFMPNQYDNPANVLAHYETTGPEIWEQTGGEIDTFVAGMGTSGTLMGTAKYLKEKNPAIRIIGIEPKLGHAIQGLKNMQESIVPGIYHPENLDDKITVEDGEAFEMARLLALKEGIFVGMSSGAAVAGALRVARGMRRGKVVAILPDRGERYLSTTLFRSICGRCPP